MHPGTEVGSFQRPLQLLLVPSLRVEKPVKVSRKF